MFLFCETQWHYSVKTRVYNTPSPIRHCISQLGENKRGQGHWVSQNSPIVYLYNNMLVGYSTRSHRQSILAYSTHTLCPPAQWGLTQKPMANGDTRYALLVRVSMFICCYCLIVYLYNMLVGYSSHKQSLIATFHYLAHTLLFSCTICSVTEAESKWRYSTCAGSTVSMLTASNSDIT